MKIDIGRAYTLLEIVTRASSNEGEAINAARQLGKMSERVGGLDKLFDSPRAPSGYSPPMSFNETRRMASGIEEERNRALAHAEALDKKVSDLLVENAALKQQITLLKDAMRKTVSVESDGSLPFPEFSHKAKLILGAGWRQEFCRQAELDTNAIDRARVQGFAPKKLVDFLSKLRPVKKPLFSLEEVRKIRTWAKKDGDAILAEKSSEAFGRVITSTMIRKLRTDLRSRNGLYGNAEFGGPLPVGEARNPNFPWGSFPDIEKLVCENSLKLDRKSAAEMAVIVSQRTGIEVLDGPIKQRCDNASPPDYMVQAITGTGPLTWPELWYLGSMIKKRGWKQTVFSHLGVEQRQPGEPLHDIPQANVEALRRTASKLKW